MCTGTPVIVWGDNLDKSLSFTYPLYDWVTRSEALDGSQFLRIESGYEDAWIVNTSYVLEGTVRFIADDGISYGWDDPVNGWEAFLEWARQKNQFVYFPDIDSAGILSYLVSPIDEPPTIEPDGTRTIRLVIRNSTSQYKIGNVINTDPDPLNVSTFPTGGLVLFLNNTTGSYPDGGGNTWYDVSGNNINFIISGSPAFTRSTGFTFNGTNQFCTTGVSSSFASFWPSGSAVTGSLTVVIACIPKAPSRNIFGQWDGPYATDQQRFKFNTDVNADYTIEASTYAQTNLSSGNNFTNASSDSGFRLSSGSTLNVLMWEVSGSIVKEVGGAQRTGGALNIYNNLEIIGRQSAVQPSSSRWYGANPEVTVATSKNNSGVYGSFFSGSIKAIMVYNRNLTALERSAVYSYISYTLPN